MEHTHNIDIALHLTIVMSVSSDVQSAFQRMGYSLGDSELDTQCAEAAGQLGLSPTEIASNYMTWAVQK